MGIVKTVTLTDAIRPVPLKISTFRSEKYLSGSSGVALIALVWVYANCAMIPGYLGVVGTWGYNCLSGTRVGSILFSFRN